MTALAVLLSIRRDSLFIAVLGLLGGFATPALLSSGENQPIPLFAYLVLLNVGLAWVAYRQRWAVLTVLTLVLTTVYQWGWVFRFLDASQVPLAMGIFAVFPVITMAALTVARRGPAPAGDGATFERAALVAAVMPLVFVVYLSAVPAYGARPVLLFGFLLLIDVGPARRGDRAARGSAACGGRDVHRRRHGGVARACRTRTAAASSRSPASRRFAVLYSLGGAIADWFGRTFDGPGEARELRGSVAALRAGGHSADRSRDRQSLGARHLHDADAARRGVAGDRRATRAAVFCRGVPRGGCAGVVVGGAPRRREAWHGRADVRAVRRRQPGGADRSRAG